MTTNDTYQIIVSHCLAAISINSLTALCFSRWISFGLLFGLIYFYVHLNDGSIHTFTQALSCLKALIQVEPHLSMADTVNKNDDESTNDSGSQQVEIFERPTGFKGLYYHPVTQVRALLRSYYYSNDCECSLFRWQCLASSVLCAQVCCTFHSESHVLPLTSTIQRSFQRFERAWCWWAGGLRN